MAEITPTEPTEPTEETKVPDYTPPEGGKIRLTDGHGSPDSNNEVNTELNHVGRNTNDVARAKWLVEVKGADLKSFNGLDWRHTALHQACFHGRYEMAKTLAEMWVERGISMKIPSNPCGRGGGTPYDLAKGGGHVAIANMIKKLMGAEGRCYAYLESGGGEEE